MLIFQIFLLLLLDIFFICTYIYSVLLRFYYIDCYCHQLERTSRINFWIVLELFDQWSLQKAQAFYIIMQYKSAENRYHNHYSSYSSYLLLLFVLVVNFLFASITFLWYWIYFLQVSFQFLFAMWDWKWWFYMNGTRLIVMQWKNWWLIDPLLIPLPDSSVNIN